MKRALQTVWATSDRAMLVPDGDPTAAFLVAAQGMVLLDSDVVGYSNYATYFSNEILVEVGKRGDYIVTESFFDATTIAGLKLWLKADSIVPLVDGTRITQWSDVSGNNYHLSAAGVDRPTLKTDVINRKPVVRFDGVANRIFNAASIAVAQPDTIIMVAFGIVNVSNLYFLSSSGAQQLLLLPNTGTYYMMATGGVAINPAGNRGGAFHIFTGVFNGASSNAYVDGVLVGSGNMAVAPVGAVYLMTNAGNTVHPPGDIAEMLIYNSALSDTNRNRVESYLKSKYNIGL